MPENNAEDAVLENFRHFFQKICLNFVKTAIKSENMVMYGYFSGAKGTGNFFLPLSTRYFGISLVPRGGGLG